MPDWVDTLDLSLMQDILALSGLGTQQGQLVVIHCPFNLLFQPAVAPSRNRAYLLLSSGSNIFLQVE
jgi:hypothetical protein